MKEIYLVTCDNCKEQFGKITQPKGISTGDETHCPKCGRMFGRYTKIPLLE